MRRATPRLRPGTLALLLLGGCLGPDAPRLPAPTQSLKPIAGLRGPDAVGLRVAVLEVPVGDRYANAGLWAAIDEQVVAPDHKAALEDNGFRVGLVGGMRPDGFADLLTSPRSNPAPHYVQMRAGNVRVLPLGGPRPLCQFRLVADGKPASVEAFEQAQYALQVTPTLTPDGDVTLAFLPLVQHGTRSPWAAPLGGEDAAPPGERYPALAWEVTLAAGEYVIVGTRFDRAGTLGHACFVDPDDARPVQRLLVVQAVRPAAGE
ncbi:MAG TPA: hypothetical protein VGF55_05075 [Gemmataceae bacterium]|jgi:hypothetical protein